MIKPTKKQIGVIQEVMEDALKSKALRVDVDGHLASIIFPSNVKVPKSMTELREELMQRGFIMFYSNYVVDSEEVFSVNVAKL